MKENATISIRQEWQGAFKRADIESGLIMPAFYTIFKRIFEQGFTIRYYYL